MIRVHGAPLDWRGHFDSLSLATSDLLGVGVPAVRQDLDLVNLQHLLRCQRHGVQHVTVVGVVVDVVMDYQPALSRWGQLVGSE